MVTRKPVPPRANSGLAPAVSPPYPVTPISTDTPRQFRMQDARNELRSATDSEPDSANVWSGEGINHDPTYTQPAHPTHPPPALPDSLKVGPHGASHQSSHEMLKPNLTSNNPFLQRAQSGVNDRKDSSADVWGVPETHSAPAMPPGAPPPPPVPQEIPPSQQFSSLSLSELPTNPWQPSLDHKGPIPPPIPAIPILQREDSGNNAWSGTPPSRKPSVPPSETSQEPALIDLEPESPAWDEDDPISVVHEMPTSPQEAQQIDNDRHAWDDNQGHGIPQGATANQFSARESAPNEPWNLIDHETLATGAQQSGVITEDGIRQNDEQHAPVLPPRRSLEQASIQPPRPTINTESSSSLPLSPAAAALVKKQKKETYEIKKIAWHDVTAAQNPRISPILVQNANGPCPLLALVNALTLSTPASEETALVETLRSREQVSLGLLLDAVFDELMSGRRGDAAQELPDVGDLYSFLITLHTGMNVNPRFFPPAPTKSVNDPRNSMSHVHPSKREGSIPGTFEETREMKLYSTFSVPLIHGWIPERYSPAYIALSRSAKSYEDAQNLMFREEELEDKLQREGLSFEEQATLEDIATIKAFFSSNATQLTPFGLETITTSLGPGAVAILFRNDHFSTLYRHPDTLQLLQLVTDMGYAGHEEVVWESLIDVTGERAEFCSGDFRVVGGAPVVPSQATVQPDGWTAVTHERTSSLQNLQNHSQHLNTPSNSRNDTATSPQSPNIEQEDHDLALALQLQEEEEERHRNELARRRRETELSQQYIEQQGGPRNTNIPVHTRGGGRGASGPTRGQGRGGPSIPPRRANPVPAPQPQRVDPEAGVDAPPPSYEQAATEAAYVPPSDHPSHPNARPDGSGSGGGRRTSAYTATSSGLQRQHGAGGTSPAGMSGSMPMGMGRGRGRRQTSSGQTLVEQIPSRRNTVAQPQQQEREKDCVIM